MSDFVLDASVALAWSLDNPVSVYALDVQQKLRKGQHGLVPALWHLEIANGLAMAVRRGDLSSTDAEDALDQILTVVVNRLHTDWNPVLAREALENAKRHQLTAYDAVYLDLARRERLPLATLDKGLRAAGVKAGVPLFK